MELTYKFGVTPDDGRSYEYPNVFAVEKTAGPERLVIAPAGQHVSLMLALMRMMFEPFGILYVLTVPRGGGEAGRYQVANPVAREEAEGFLGRFKEFFENDGRHHIWIASVGTSDSLVYDNHNVIYAYGELREFERVLVKRGLTKVDCVEFPSPHTHKYNRAFDRSQQEVLGYWEWKQFPLQEDDDP
ncbi:MAG TPA: hypothetical protein VK738_17930 [Terriglobales bacterium]|jgi:hypothetical protein|nr:hypothetical protein [Terriglobales bacterium]